MGAVQMDPYLDSFLLFEPVARLVVMLRTQTLLAIVGRVLVISHYLYII